MTDRLWKVQDLIVYEPKLSDMLTVVFFFEFFFKNTV